MTVPLITCLNSDRLTSWKEKLKATQTCPTLCDPMGYTYNPWNPLGQYTRVGSLSPLQGIFPTHGLNPGLPHCRRILHQLSHKGSPRILEWVAYPFPSRSCRPGNWTRVSCIEGGCFTNWAMREAQRWVWSVSVPGFPVRLWSKPGMDAREKLIWGHWRNQVGLDREHLWCLWYRSSMEMRLEVF